MQKTNQLIHEPSPYLQQHAYNPVNWFAWNAESLEKAKKENKPILLSIGYAACHWCHVMGHESFEDHETAELMNRYFINIKVDKEERPDLDKIYQTAHYLLGQKSGGWPLTVFMTPNRIPFFSGTYFPLEEHYQLPSFKRILKFIIELYEQRQEEILQQNQELTKILQQQAPIQNAVVLNEEPLQLALRNLEKNFDLLYGGFNKTPKFPEASKIRFLVENHSPLAKKTLLSMAMGGIYDQLAGGFFRYSVDQQWMIPHFEKMLYDNGQLLTVYALAAEEFNEPFFKEILQESATWLVKNLEAPEGGFYSSFDADSEGVEGKFYRWTSKEVQSLLTAEEFALLRPYYALDQIPNLEEHWHLYQAHSLKSAAELAQLGDKDAQSLLISAKHKLLCARNKRKLPFRDEKILSSWNGLTINGLLKAGICLNEKNFISSAQKSLYFIQNNLWSEGYLKASFKGEKAYLGAYLDDYAFLLEALLTSLQWSWNSSQLNFAIAIAERLLDSFIDKQNGGFFFTAENHEKLLYRPKIMMDEATPSANGVLTRAFLLLGHLLGETRYLAAAKKTLQAAWPLLMQYPSDHCSLVLALKEYLNPKPIVILRGELQEMKEWQSEISSLKHYCFAIPAKTQNLPQILALKKPKKTCSAYICRGLHCEPMISDKNQLKKLL